MRKNRYNNSLMIVLIATTVIICAIFAVAAVLTHDKENPGNERTEGVAENQTVQPSENDEGEPQKPLVSEENEAIGEPEQTEKPIQKDEAEEDEDENETSSAENKQDSGEDGDWNLILANPRNRIPEDFTVELAEIGSGHKVDARIVDELNQMMSDLRAAGLSAFVCSSYRTNTHQTNLYNNEVNEYRGMGYSDEDAAVMAAKWVAIPGTSEHQTGLAVDIMSSHYLVLDKGQEDTAEQQWLMQNSYKYGFILRYPSEKSEITGINYEPWHYRYVGKEAAKEIFEKEICFEEYLLL